MFTALGRGFNPVADIPLAEAGLRLLTGATGPLMAAAGVLGALAAVLAVAGLLWWATGLWAGLAPGRLPRRAAAGGSDGRGGNRRGRDRAGDGALEPSGGAARCCVHGARRPRAGGDGARDASPISGSSGPRRPRTAMPARRACWMPSTATCWWSSSRATGGRAMTRPLYAATHRATLAAAEDRLGDLGLSMRSGYVAAPTRGGQSWLSHATFANGLWIADQTSYGAVLASGRETLYHIAARSGFRTAAVMPQITLDWPEADFMGFGTVLAAEDLGYEGLPFNWVTMPDQFTFAALDRLLRTDTGGRPLFAQVALGSSHAPWGAGAGPRRLGEHRRWLGLRRDGPFGRPARRGLARPRPGARPSTGWRWIMH